MRAIAALDIVKVRLQVGRPDVESARRTRQLFAGRAQPALSYQVAERGGSGTVDGHFDVVIRAVRPAPRVDPPRIVRIVRRRVPPRRGEIEPADERHCIVDDDDLLVLRASQRMMVVETEVEARVGAARPAMKRQDLALQGIDDREVPIENADTQRSTAPDQAVEERPDLVRVVPHPSFGPQSHAAVEIPADYQDRMASARCRRHEGAKERLSVDEHGGAGGRLDTPTVLARSEDRRVPERRGRVGPGARIHDITPSRSRFRATAAPCNGGAVLRAVRRDPSGRGSAR